MAEREQSARVLQLPPRTDEPAPQPPAARRSTRTAAVVVAGVVALALWAASSLVDGLPGPLDGAALAAAALSPFAVVAAIPVVALALRGRLWSLALVAALAGLLPWVFVLGYASPAAAGPADSDEVRVSAMLLDADGGRADASLLVAAVPREGVDVLVLEGATPVLVHDVTAAGLDPRLRPRWASSPDTGAADETVVWSRFAVARVDPIAGTSEPAARLVVDTGRGSLTLVVGRAWPGGYPRRWRGDLAALGRAADVQGPVALAGSLDAVPQQAAFRRLTSGGLTDAADVLGRGARPTWPSWSPLPFLPVDHVLVGGGVGVRAVMTVPVAGTSHRALTAKLTVPAAQPPAGTTAGGD